MSGLTTVLSQLLSRTSCSQCGGPLGRVTGYIVGEGQTLCDTCYQDYEDRLIAEVEAEYWAQRAEAERECAER